MIEVRVESRKGHDLYKHCCLHDVSKTISKTCPENKIC